MALIPLVRVEPLPYHFKRLENLLRRGFEYEIKSVGRNSGRESLVESDVVHTITQIRKVLELTDARSRWPYLTFFSDWTLHTSIDRSDIPLGVFKKITNVMIYGHENIQTWIRPLEDVTFGAFRAEFARFLTTHSLPVDTIQSDAHWKAFLEGYVPLVAGSPLRLHRHKTAAQQKQLRTSRKWQKWGIVRKVCTLTLTIKPPHDSRRFKGGRGQWSPVPLPEWRIGYESGDFTNVPCIFYSLNPPSDLELWHGLVHIGPRGTLN